MEQSLLERLNLHLAPNSDPHRRLRSLITARSLLLNPSSSSSTRRAVSDALIRSLSDHAGDPTFLRHAITLLSGADAPSVTAAVRRLLISGDHLAADALASLDGDLISSILDEDVILSLAESRHVSVRSRLLNLLVTNPTLLRPHLVFRVYLSLAVDIYPLVRRSALDGLIVLCERKKDEIDRSVVGCCYERAVVLLGDDEELVRAAAVRLVSECGKIFAMAEEGMDSSERMDLIFLQLSSIARDMSMKVRIEAFIALGKVRLVSEGVLLQSLSKKISKIKRGGKTLADSHSHDSKFMLSSAAGAFVHGIEDEFHEVRSAACKSLGMLTAFSVKFADDTLNLLMDMLNDDAAAVRLQILQTLYYMAASDRLSVQERHMHLFLGLLADISDVMRSVTRKVIQLMRLPGLVIFRSTIDALITNMETYPKEEEDILFVLFLIGKNHGSFAAKLSKELSAKLTQSFDEALSLDSPRVAALLVLAISSSFSDKKDRCDIPSSLFSYALPLFGRISRSLVHVLNQDVLLDYLCYHSGLSFLSTTSKLIGKHALTDMVKEFASNYRKQITEISNSLLVHDETSTLKFKNEILDLNKKSTPLGQPSKREEYMNQEISQCIKLVLTKVTGTWQLIQSCCTFEAQRTLRACREELEMIVWNANASDSSVLAFMSQYVQVILLVAELWQHVKPKKSYATGMVASDLLLDKLDLSLKIMRYIFPGLSREEECHILELTLFAYVLRLCKPGPCSYSMLNKFRTIIVQLDHLHEGQSALSDFAKEVKKYCDQDSCTFPARSLLELFCLEQLPLSGRFRHVKAELEALENNSENPLPFISGLPVGITLQIILYNVSNNDRLCTQMAVGGLVQNAFLDLYEFEGTDEVRKCVVNLPFYATPNAASFLLKTCICFQCPLEDASYPKKGPEESKDIIPLCEEKDIYLVKVEG